MCSECLCPCRRRTVLESVATADKDSKIALLALCLASPCAFEERLGDHLPPCRPETVVVQPENLETAVVDQKRDDWVDGSTTERVVAEVDLD
jgi:hypothetical protein